MLDVRELAFTYPGAGAPALEPIDLCIDPGTITLLEGPSGGGKTTLLRALSGAIPHLRAGLMTGSVELDGVPTRSIDPARLALDVGRLFQDPEAQAVMASVWRDVAFGPENAGRSQAQIVEDVEWALSVVGAEHLASRRIDELSSGERQRVAIAGVLATHPRVLLLDEPLSQLDHEGAAGLVETLSELKACEMATVVSEHRVEALAAVADGHVMLGASGGSKSMPTHSPRSGGGLAARIGGIVAGYGASPVLRGCDLDLSAGTVTALHGPNGSGKSTLLRVIAGLHEPAHGIVEIGGRDVTARPIEQRVPAVGLLAQDPGRHLLTESVLEEVDAALRIRCRSRVERRRAREATIRACGLDGFESRHPHDLSVGERERVALAAALAPSPDLLLLDEPTRGMDVRRKGELAGLLRGVSEAGAAVLVATHDMEFANAVADRHVEMRDGGVERSSPLAAGVAS